MINNINATTQRRFVPSTETESTKKVELNQQPSKLTSLQKLKQENALCNDTVDMDKIAQAKAMIKNPKNAINLDTLTDKIVDFYHGNK